MVLSSSKSLRDSALRLWLTAAVVTTALACRAVAALPVPTDLAPGQPYHLLFNSAATLQATSSNIADYNAFVQTAANAAGIGNTVGVAWKALASTASVDARVNAVVGASTPVYNMNLQRIANGFADLWDGTLTTGAGWDETGSVNASLAWTGSLSTGLKDGPRTLGNISGFTRAGAPTFTNTMWFSFPSDVSQASFFHVYGLSQQLTAPVGGDLDGDGDVDGNDVLLWQRGQGTTYGPETLATIRTNFGVGAQAAAANSVPEPTAGALAAAALASLVLRRRAR